MNGIKNLWKRGLSLLLCLAMLLPMLPTTVFAADTYTTYQPGSVDDFYTVSNVSYNGTNFSATVSLKNTAKTSIAYTLVGDYEQYGVNDMTTAQSAINGQGAGISPSSPTFGNSILPVSQSGKLEMPTDSNSVMSVTLNLSAVSVKEQVKSDNTVTSIDYYLVMYDDQNHKAMAKVFTIPIKETAPDAELTLSQNTVYVTATSSDAVKVTLTNTKAGSTAGDITVSTSDGITVTVPKSELGGVGSQELSIWPNSSAAAGTKVTLNITYKKDGKNGKKEATLPLTVEYIPAIEKYVEMYDTLTNGNTTSFNDTTTRKDVTVLLHGAINIGEYLLSFNSRTYTIESVTPSDGFVVEKTGTTITRDTVLTAAASQTASENTDSGTIKVYADGTHTNGTLTVVGTQKVGSFGTANKVVLSINLTYTPGEETTYTVSFNLNGAAGTAPADQTVTSGGKATKPADPTHSGYTFAGWYTAADGGTPWNFDTNTVSANTILYAHWTQQHTVTFNANGGTVSPATATVAHGGTLSSLPTPTYAGHTFNGWFTEATGGEQFTTSTVVNADTTLYAHWTKDTEAIKLAPNNKIVTYNGDDQLPTLTFVKVSDNTTVDLGSGDYTVAWTKSGTTVTEAINVGEYIGTVSLTNDSYTFGSDGNTFTLTIQKADLNVKVEPANGEQGTTHSSITITLTGPKGALTDGNDYDLGDWLNGSNATVTLGTDTTQGIYHKNVTLKGDAETNYNKPTVEYTVGPATKYTAKVTVRVDGTPTSTGIEKVMLGADSSNFTVIGSGSSGVYTFPAILNETSYAHAQVTISDANRNNNNAMGTYEFKVDVSKDNKEVYIDLYTVRLTSNTLENGLSSATVGGKGADGYVIVPKDIPVNLSVTVDTSGGYKQTAWTAVGSGTVDGGSLTKFTSGQGFATLTPHATPLSRIAVTKDSAKVESLTATVPQGYTAQTLLNGTVANDWPRAIGTLNYKFNTGSTYTDNSTNDLTEKLTATLGTTVDIKGDTTSTLTVDLAADLAPGEYHAKLWLYDSSTIDTSLCAPLCIPITVTVNEAGNASASPSSFTWDTYTQKVTKEGGTASNKDDAVTTITMADISNIVSVSNSGTTLDSTNAWSQSGDTEGRRTLTINNSYLQTLNGATTLTVTARNKNNVEKTTTITINVVDTMPSVTGVTLDKNSIQQGETVSVKQITTSEDTLTPSDSNPMTDKFTYEWYLGDVLQPSVTGYQWDTPDDIEKGKTITVKVIGRGVAGEPKPETGNSYTGAASVSGGCYVQEKEYTVIAKPHVITGSEGSWTIGTEIPSGATATPSTSTNATKSVGTPVGTSASANSGYKFKKWLVQSGGGSFTSDAAPNTTFKPTADSTVVAGYIEVPVLSWAVGQNTDSSADNYYQTSGEAKKLSDVTVFAGTVTNIGKADAANVAYTIDGATTGEFTVSTPANASTPHALAKGDSEAVKITVTNPATLAPGSYTNDLVIKYTQDGEDITIKQQFTFKVDPAKYHVSIDTSDPGVSNITGTIAGTSDSYTFSDAAAKIEDGQSLQVTAAMNNPAGTTNYLFGGWQIVANAGGGMGTGTFGGVQLNPTSFKPGSDVTIKAISIPQPVMGLAQVSATTSAKRNQVSTSTDVYTGTLTNSGVADATAVSYSLEDVGGGNTTASLFTLAVTGSSALTNDTVESDNTKNTRTITIKPASDTMPQQTYQFNLKITYKHKILNTADMTAIGQTDKEETITKLITFTVEPAEYTVTKTDPVANTVTISGTYNNTPFDFSNGKVTEGGALYVTTSFNAKQYRFNKWTVDGLEAAPNGSFTSPTSTSTTFNPTANAAISVSVTAIATLENTENSKTASVDKTALSASTTAYTGTLTNNGAANATSVAYAVHEQKSDGSYAVSNNFDLVAASSELKTAIPHTSENTVSYEIKPKDHSTLAAGTYNLRIVVTYKAAADDDAAVTVPIDDFTFRVTDDYFAPSVTVKKNDTAVGNSAVVTIKSGGSTYSLTDTDGDGTYTYTSDSNASVHYLANGTYDVTVQVDGDTFTDVKQVNQSSPDATVELVTVGATVSPDGSGSVSGTGTYLKGSTVTLTATPNSGYDFVKWEDNSTSLTRTIASLDTATAVTATFQDYYYVAFALDRGTNAASNGAPTATRKLTPSDNLYTAAINDPTRAGYDFTNWTASVNGNSNHPTYTTLSATGSTQANETALSTLLASLRGSSQTVNPGATITLTATWTAEKVTYQIDNKDTVEYNVTYGDMINMDLGTAKSGDTDDDTYITYTYTPANNLPAGLSLNSSGVLSGQPRVASGSYEITITATDTRNGEKDTVTVTLKPQKRDPVFSTAEINPNATDKTVAATTKIATVTAPYWDGDEWTTYSDSVVVSGSSKVAGEGALEITDPDGETVLTVTGVDCDLKYTPADTSTHMTGKPSDIYNTVTKQDIKVTSGGSITQVEGPSLTILPALHTFDAVDKGYDAITAAGLNITNNGGVKFAGNDLTVTLGQGDNSVFDISATETVTTNKKELQLGELAAGASQVIYIQPKANLGVGFYSDTVTVTSESTGKSATATVQFQVKNPENYTYTVNTFKNDVGDSSHDAYDVTKVEAVSVTDSNTKVAAVKDPSATGVYKFKGTDHVLDWDTVYWIYVNGVSTGKIVTNANAGQSAEIDLYQVTVAAMSGETDLASSASLDGDGYYLPGQSVSLSSGAVDDYVFVNWTDNASATVATTANYTYTMPAAAKALTANYAAVYGVAYDLQDGTGTAPADANKYKVNDTVILDSGSGLSKTGYTFGGWHEDQDQHSGGVYSYTMVAQVSPGVSKTFYAVWVPKDLMVQKGTVTGTYNTAITDVPIEISNGTGNYTVTDPDNGLPTGLDLDNTSGTWKITGTPTQTVTNKTVNLTVKDNGSDKTTTVAFVVNIAKADITINAQDFTENVGTQLGDTEIQNATHANASHAPDSVTGTWTVKQGGTTIDSSNKLTVAEGPQTVTLTFTPTDDDANNYNEATKTVTVTGQNRIIAALDIEAITDPEGGKDAPASADITDNTLKDDSNPANTLNKDDVIESITVSWSPAPDTGKFVGSTSYTATITVTPKTGWKFKTDGTWTYANGAAGDKAEVTTITPDVLTYTVYFPIPQIISSVAITTTLPQDQGVGTTVTSAAPTMYTIAKKDGTTDDVTWTDTNGNVTVDSSHKFATGGIYTLTVKLKPTEGNEFATGDNAVSGTVNGVGEGVTVTEISQNSVTVKKTFTIEEHSKVGVMLDSGNLEHLDYYAKTDTDTGASATTVTGRRNDIPYAWSEANDIQVKFVLDDGSTTEAESIMETVEGSSRLNANWSFVYYDTATSTYKDMPANGTPFANGSAGAATAAYDGKNVYLMYNGFTAPVYLGPLGVLTVRELEAKAIDATARTAKLNYVEGQTFAPSDAKAEVVFNTDAAGLKNPQVAVDTLGTTDTNSTEFYYAYKTVTVADSTTTTTYTILSSSTPMTVSAHNGKELYICYTDINDHTVRSYVGALTVAGETTVTVKIKKGADEVNGTTVFAEYGDVLTADVQPQDEEHPITGSLKYKWQIFTDGSTWTDIPNATDPNYVPKADDVGKQIKVVVTETGKAGQKESNPVTVYPRTVTFDVKSYNKPYDGTAANEHDRYTGDDFILSNVLSGDTVTLTYNKTSPVYGGIIVDSTITWPAIENAILSTDTATSGYEWTVTVGGSSADAGIYRLGIQDARTNRGKITKAIISTIEISVEIPNPGSALDTDPSTTATSYTLGTHDWKDGSNTDVTNGNAAYNTSYTITVPVSPETGYQFADGVTATITSGGQTYAGTVVKTDDGVSVSYTFPAVTQSLTVGVTASGQLDVTAYYAKTGTHTDTSATGHKTNVTFAWDNTSDTSAIQYQFVKGDGTKTDKVTVDLASDDWSLVYGDSPADAKDQQMPANGIEFTTVGKNDVATYDGKKVYLQYKTGDDALVAPEPVGTLTVKQLQATGITPSGYGVKLSYQAGEAFEFPATALTASVDFNTATALENKGVEVATLGYSTGSSTAYYYAIKNGNAYNPVTDGQMLTTADNGKGLYMGYTDINNNSVYAFLGTLSVVGNTDAGVTIQKGGAPIHDTTNPAEYGDTLTAEVSGNTGAPTYQWQISEDGGSTWTNIDDATDPTYVPKAKDIGDKIRVVVKENGKPGSAASAPVNIQKRTITFTVKSFDKPYDGTADNKHTTYSGADFTLSNVVNNDVVSLTYTGTVPNYQTGNMDSEEVGSTITWPAVTAESDDYTVGGAQGDYYRVGEQNAIPSCGSITSAEISNIKISVVQPVPGSALGTPGKTVDADPYALSTHAWKKGGTEVSGDADYSTTYTIEVPVTPNDGYVFKDGVTATVNVGGTNYVGTVNRTSGTAATVTFIFPTTPAAAGDTSIQNVDVHFAASPVYGEDIPKVPTGYTVDTMVSLVDQDDSSDVVTARWYEGNFAIANLGTATAVTGKFKANTKYTVVVEVTAQSGYAFDTGTKFFFHFGAGETVLVTPAEGTSGSKLMYYTFEHSTIDPSTPGDPTSMSVTLDANRYYYVTTDKHKQANRTTIPGSNVTPLFEFDYEVSGSVYYEAIGFNKTLSMNEEPDNNPDPNVLYYKTGWNYVAADSASDTNAVVVTNGQTFADESLNGKHLYIKVGDTIMDTDLGILTVVKLRADSIEPVYQPVTRATATAADMLSYNEGDHFIDVIASANVSFNVYDGNGVYRTIYDEATKAGEADTEGEKYYFELEDGAALKSDATNGTELTKAAHNGKVVYLCYTDVHGNEVRTPLGALAVDSTASTAAIAVRNNTHANKDTQYGDELVAVVSGSTTNDYTYQWQSRTAAGTWADIDSATDSTYTVAKTDVDKFIRVVLTRDGGKDVTTTPVVSDSTADGTDMSGMEDSNDHIYADKRDLTVTWTWTPGSKVYDGAKTAALTDDSGDSNFTYTVEGKAGSDTVTLENVTAATFDDANVGTNKTITIIGGSLSAADQACYNLKTVNAPKGAITALQLEWSDFTFIPKQDKTYDGTTAVKDHTTAEDVTWSTAGDNKITGTNPTITVSYAYTSKDALGTNASSIEAKLTTTDTNVILPAGSHYIDGCTISPKEITVGKADLDAADKNPTTTVGTATKTLNGDVDGNNNQNRLATGDTTLDFTVVGVFADVSVPASGVAVTISQDSLSWNNRNYALTWDGDNTTTGTVSPATIHSIVSAGNGTGVYGEKYSTIKDLGVKVKYTADGPEVTLNTLAELKALGITVKVGSTDITDGTANIPWDTQTYTVSKDGLVSKDGTITVSPRPLTVTGASWSFENGKYYDGNTTINGWDVKNNAKNTTGAITLTFDGGIMAGDTPTATYTYTAALDNENAGEHHTIKITGIALTGTNKERYSLPVNTFDLREQKIVARPVTVQFTKPSVVKDSPVTVTLAGVLVESDGTTALATSETVPVTAQGTYASTANVGDNINVAVADFTVSNPNYNVTKVTSIEGSVTKKQITSVSVTYTAPAKSGTAAEEVGYSDTAEVGDPTTKWYESSALTKGAGAELTVGTSTFEAGKSYRVEATFAPNIGYAFATNDSDAITTNFSLNGKNYTVGGTNAVKNDDGTVTVMAVFSVPADSKTIQHINLALTAPVVDAQRATSATVSSATTDQGGDAKTGVATPVSVNWAADKDGDGIFEVTDGNIGKFLSGYTYQATITGVNADTANGWTLAGDVDFAVNGVGPVKHSGSATSGNVTVAAAKQENGTYNITVTFPKQGSKLVESVYVNTILPAEHGKTVPNVYVVTTEPYEATKTDDVADLYWEVSDTGNDGTWTKVAVGTRFDHSKFYRVTGKVQLKSANYTAYDITANTKFFVGGEAISQSADGTNEVTVNDVKFYAKFVATDPTTGAPVTANDAGEWPDNTVYTLTLTTETALANKTDKKIVKIAADILQPVALKTLPSAAGAASKLLAQNAAGESLIDGLEVSSVTWKDVTTNSAVALGTTEIRTDHTYEASFTVTAKTENEYRLKADGTDLVDFLINGVLTAGNEWINGEATDVTDTARNISVTTAKNGSADSYTITVRFTDVGESADVLTVWGLAKVPEAKEDILNTDLDLQVASTQPYKIVGYDVKTHWNHKNTTTGDWEKIGAANESASDIPKFEAGELYQAVISVKLKDDMKGYGYAFTTSTAGYINDTTVNATEVKYFDSSNHEINPRGRADTEVDLIELKREFVVPATEVYVRVASDPPEDGSVVDDINRSIVKPDDADAGYTLSGGKWYTDQDGTIPVTKFEAGKTYYLVVNATPDDDSYTVPGAGVTNGYHWDDDQCSALKVEEITGGTKVTFKYRIRATQAPDLYEIPANATPPATKQPLDGTGWTSENFNIVGGVTWYKGDKAEGTPVTGNAEGETVYTAQVTVVPKDNINIAGGAVCKFNNNTLRPDQVIKNEDGSYTMIYTFPKTEKITTSGGGTTVVPGPTVTVTEEVEVPVVTYWLGIQGITNDLTAEKVAAGGKPTNVPRVTCVQEGYSFVGWSETDPTRTKDPKLVDPRTFTIDADKTFFAVYKSTQPATAKHEHYIKGYDTGVFLPLGGITRAELAAIIARSCGRGYVEGANYGNAGMSDIDGHWARSAIAFCIAREWLSGYPDGTFRPDTPISRQEFAVAFARMAGMRPLGTLNFIDSNQIADWAKAGVYTCVANGWVNGYPDGSFRPEAPMLRSEAVKIMNGYLKRGVDEKGLSEVLDLLKIFPDVPKDYWAYFEIIEASNDHEFYYVGEDGTAPPEHWTDAYVGQVSWGS